MNRETFNKAVKLDKDITDLRNEIDLLLKYATPTTTYSVTVNTTQASKLNNITVVDKETVAKFGNELLNGMIERKKKELARLEHEFKIA